MALTSFPLQTRVVNAKSLDENVAAVAALKDATVAAAITSGTYASAADAIADADLADGAKFWAPSGLDTLQQFTKTGGAAVEVPGNAMPTAGFFDGPGLSLINISGFISTSGSFSSPGNTDWSCSDFLPLDLMSVQKVDLVGSPSVMSIAYYRENKTFISGVAATTTLGRVTAWPAPPDGAAYVRFSRRASGGHRQSLVISQPVDKVAGQSAQARLASSALALFTVPGYINLSGALTAGTFISTDYIPVSSVKVSSLRLSGHTAALSVSFFTAAKIFISGSAAAGNGDVFSVMPAIPANAAFMRFTTAASVAWQQELVLEANLAAIVPQVAQGKLPVDLAPFATTSGFLAAATGLLSAPDLNWLSTDFIPCNPGDTFNVSTWGNAGAGTLCFYGPTRAFISPSVASGATGMFAAVGVAPAGAAFVRLCVGNPAGTSVPDWVVSTCMVDFAYAPAILRAGQAPTEFDLLPFPPARKLALTAPQKGMLAGDSISSTDYPWYKEAMESLTGIDWYNGGFSGYTAAQLASDACLNRIWTYGGDIVLFMPGGNDTGAAGTVGTFGAITGEPLVTETSLSADYSGATFIQAVSHVVRKFKSRYENIRERAALTGSETEAEKNAKIAAVLKPTLILATTLPMNRSGAYDVTENQVRKRNAIVEVSQRYKVGCVDLYNLCGFNRSLEPYPESPTNKTENKGVLTMDGLHPNQFGYRRIAEINCGQIGL